MTGSVIIMPPGADIFASDCEVLVSPVDATTGAQGKGLAKLFAQRFPTACAAYKKIAQRGVMNAGEVWVWHQWIRSSLSTPPQWIFFAATKQHWRHASAIEDVAACARNIRREAMSLRSIAIPALGCGLGGLSWESVRGLLETEARIMAAEGITVKLYPPHDRGDR